MIDLKVKTEPFLFSEMKQAIENIDHSYLELIYNAHSHNEYSDYFINNIHSNFIYYSVSLKNFINYPLPNDTIYISTTFSRQKKLMKKIFDQEIDDEAMQLFKKILMKKILVYEKNYYKKELNHDKILIGAIWGQTLISQIDDKSFVKQFLTMALNLNYQYSTFKSTYFFKSNQSDPLNLKVPENEFKINFCDIINHSLIYDRHNFINKFMKNKDDIAKIVFSPSSNYSEINQKAIDYLFSL